MLKNRLRPRLPSTSKAGSGLRRALSPFQIQLLSMGGVIGVGLFYGAGQALQLAGPSVIVDYVVGGIIVAIVMRALGEMTVEDPRAGSFSRYAKEALGPMAGFLTGGVWWFFWVATVMSELAAIGLLIEFWFPHFPAWIPSFLALAIFAATNLMAVEVFGTIEVWFALAKILAIAAFMVLGLIVAIPASWNPASHAGIPGL